MFYEAMEEILPDLKVIIESPSGDMQTIYPVESFTGSPDSGTDNTDRSTSADNTEEN